MQGLSECQRGWNRRKLGGCHVVNPGCVVACHHTHTLPASHISKHIPKHLVEKGSVRYSVFGVVNVEGQRGIVGWPKAVLSAV